MGATFQFLINGDAADDDLLTVMGPLEVEENADLPGAIQVTLPASKRLSAPISGSKASARWAVAMAVPSRGATL